MLKKENAHRVSKRNYRNGSSQRIYHFYCLECNKELNVQISAFKRHSGKCQRCSQLGEPYFFIYNELKNHRNKKVEFNISFEDFKKIIENNFCHYCSKELHYNKHSRQWGKNLSRAHQLDRKNNSKGYILNNVVPCCWTCNRLKSNEFTYEEFLLLSPILKQIQLKRRCEIQ